MAGERGWAFEERMERGDALLLCFDVQEPDIQEIQVTLILVRHAISGLGRHRQPLLRRHRVGVQSELKVDELHPGRRRVFRLTNLPKQPVTS